MEITRLDFRLLQTRLLTQIRARVQNGEISERALARLSGLSQPHLHNVLKGARFFSLQAADQVLQSLRIDLLDLLTHTERGGYGGTPGQEAPALGDCRMVPLLEGWIGRHDPFPKRAGSERYPFPSAEVARLAEPVAARLAPDSLRAPPFGGRGVVLMDRAAAVRKDPDGGGYFALDLSGGGAIGLVRHIRRDAQVWVRHAEAWRSIPVSGRDPLEVIQGRVSLLVRQL